MVDSGIYKIQNIITKDFYIGSAIHLMKRKANHFYNLRKKNHPNIHLQRVWNNYREENFIFLILLYCEPLELLRYEQWFIDNYKPRYNILRTAGNCLGHKRSIISRIKQSETRKKLKSKIWNAGKPWSKEMKQKLSDVHKGKSQSLECKLKRSKTIKEWWRKRKNVTN